MTHGTACAPILCDQTGEPIGEHELKALCKQAPCGRGAKTVLDASIRKTLETQQVVVRWDGLAAVLADCARRLCPWLRLEAAFYKVLVYEAGDFFSVHVDSKRGPNHLLTLVVTCSGGPCDGGAVSFDADLVEVAAVLKEGAAKGAVYEYKPEVEDEEEAEAAALLPRCFIESALPTKAEYLASLQMADSERIALERAHGRKAGLAVVDADAASDTASAGTNEVEWTASRAGAWCCWFASQPHAVRPLISGRRVVATYDVYGTRVDVDAAETARAADCTGSCNDNGEASHVTLLALPAALLRQIALQAPATAAARAACACKALRALMGDP